MIDTVRTLSDSCSLSLQMTSLIIKKEAHVRIRQLTAPNGSAANGERRNRGTGSCSAGNSVVNVSTSQCPREGQADTFCIIEVFYIIFP